MEATASRNLFKDSDVLNAASKVYTVEVSELSEGEGGCFTFCKLTYAELRELRKILDLEERGLTIIAKMVEKANPDLTAADVKARLERLPADLVALISQRMEKAGGFLWPSTLKP